MKPSEMTDQELVEAFFVEAYGAYPDEARRFSGMVSSVEPVWKFEDGRVIDDPLPNILDSESAFNEWVLPVMEGMDLNMVWMANGLVLHRNAWENAKVEAFTFDHKNRRLRAAVEGALEIVRGRGEVEK